MVIPSAAVSYWPCETAMIIPSHAVSTNSGVQLSLEQISFQAS
jgi:hypothetical protein